MDQVLRKIEREKVIINAANTMRQSSNPQVQASLDSQVREARKGIQYLEQRLRQLQMRKAGQGADGQSQRSSGGPLPPAHGGLSSSQNRQLQRVDAPTPPPKDGRSGYLPSEGGDYGDPGPGGYMNDLSGGHGMMPPRAPFGPPAPGSSIPRSRPNYTKLGNYPRAIKHRLTANGNKISLRLIHLTWAPGSSSCFHNWSLN